MRKNNSDVGPLSTCFGLDNIASGSRSFAEGWNTEANGPGSHAEGYETKANGNYSHAQGYKTVANRAYQVAIGEFNEIDNYNLSTGTRGKYAFIIGNGIDDDNRSNAITVDWNGNINALGSLFTGMANEWAKKGTNHIVIAGVHVCWGDVKISASANSYAETQVTLPYTYTSTPIAFASLGNRSAQARTAYATQGNLAGDKLYVGCYSTAARDIYVSWMTIGI